MSPFKLIFALITVLCWQIMADFSNDVEYLATECFTLHHHEAFRGALLAFSKRNRLSDEEMAQRLLYIAARPTRFIVNRECSPSRAAVSGLFYFPNATNAISALEDYILNPETQLAAIGPYGRISGFNDRYFTFMKTAVAQGKVDKDFYLTEICRELRNATSPNAKWERSEKSILHMKRILITGTSDSFDNMVSLDRYLFENYAEYANSIEHVRAQEKVANLLAKQYRRIVRYSCYRGEWGGAAMSDDEWCQNVSNACQSEIARVMALPEGERLNMTAILDAKIAAIEDGEARVARRATWKRRLRLIGCILLPVSLLTLVAIVLRRIGSGGLAGRNPRPRLIARGEGNGDG